MNKALAAVGLYAVEQIRLDQDEYWLWPENDDVFRLWLAVQTQWTVAGMGGAIGLNYSGVEACMRLRGLGRKKSIRAFEQIQAMEQVTLEEWARKR